MPYTLGFRTPAKLTKHFEDHGSEVGATDAMHYQALADAFLGTPHVAHSTIHERKTPRRNDIVRYDSTTEEFGILANDGYIRTYMIADPNIHGFSTNYDFYVDRCGRA